MIASFFVDECCDAKTMEKLLIKSAAVFFECGLTEFLLTCDGENDVIIAEESRTIIAEQSPFWSKFSLVAWNT